MKPSRSLLWVLSLGVAAVGIKNFEPGLAIDAPFYASVGRNLAISSDWFYLSAGIPELTPFTDHPPFGMWLLGLVFKILPAEDWSARLLTEVFYVLFLWMLFHFVQKNSGEKIAVWTIILLWSWSRFSNFFANVYLDPGALLFGMAALVTWKRSPLLSGFLFSLAILYKGLAVAGFLIPIGLFALEKPRVKDISLFVLGVSLPLIVFTLAVFQSSVPDYWQRYWNLQMGKKLAPKWSGPTLLSGHFWWLLWRDTNYFLPLVLFSLRKKDLKIPLATGATFLFLIAQSGLVGNQYWLYVMPWLAWLIAAGVFVRIPMREERLVGATAFIAIAAALIIQYLPIRIHAYPPTDIELALRWDLTDQKRISYVVIDSGTDFIITSRLAWYGKTEIRPNPVSNQIPGVSKEFALLQYSEHPDRAKAISQTSWTLHGRYHGGHTLWLSP